MTAEHHPAPATAATAAPAASALTSAASGNRAADDAAAARALLTLLCRPRRRRIDRSQLAPLLPPRTGWGSLLHHAIEHKLVCVLAEALTHADLTEHVPARVMRHLHGVWRANQHKTHLYRAEAAKITHACRGIQFAACGGIAAESTLYGGSGTRQLSDIDLLVTGADLDRTRDLLTELGYRAGARGTLIRSTGDLVLPAVHVDVTSRLPGDPRVDDPASHHLMQALLSRRAHQPIPGHPTPLPVLTPADAYPAALLRLATPAKTATGHPLSLFADAAHLHPHTSTAPRAEAGWTHLADPLWALLHEVLERGSAALGHTLFDQPAQATRT